ncbi:MAG: metalloregulator ArsR/SmtB family transcription factor [Pseudomonadota bacterium]
MTLQATFRGLADPTRRDILKMLAEQEMTIAEVAERFEMTRGAVKKHLQVLEESNLIGVRTMGRTRVNHLQAKAMLEARDWMNFFEAYWDDRFSALDKALQSEMERQTKMTDTLTKSAFFPVPPDMVWSYLTDKDKLGTWYHPATADLTEGEPYELVNTNDAGETVRQVWGRVIRADKPRQLVCTFEIPYFDGDETTVTWTLEPLAGGTKLSLSHDGIATASGEAASRLLSAIDKGWDEHLSQFRDAILPKVA